MPFKLTRKGYMTLATPGDLSDEKVDILWIVKERNEERGGITQLKDIVQEAGRGRETFADVRDLLRRGYLEAFDY